MNITTSYRLVDIVNQLSRLADWLTAGPLRRSIRNRKSGVLWPSLPGAYVVGDRSGSVAVCTLCSDKLIAPLATLPGVAVAGRVYTANLGIEKIIANITANPTIRFLILCGNESPFFQVGQALNSLKLNGQDAEHHIIGAQGHLPQLNNLQSSRIEHFRRQVEIVDCVGETDVDKLATVVQRLTLRDPGRFNEAISLPDQAVKLDTEAAFKTLRPGGHREPLAYDPNGFFVISLDRKMNDIQVRHYLPNNTPVHSMSGRNAEAILLGLLREGLVSQMSHAGYLGSELTKAETALRLGLNYEQDQPLRS